MHEELRAIYEQDQADRMGAPPVDVLERDRARRERVEAIVASGVLQTADDYFHAAMIFQHGERPEDPWRAYELAQRAAALGHMAGRWLVAAAYDRWLLRQGKPQKYGTQYIMDRDHWVLADVDPATTDAERAEWDVPPLAQAHAQAAAFDPPRPLPHQD
jgi:TPR repeat protein